MPSKFIWKVPLKNYDASYAHHFFELFNTWIPNSPEIFVDVADYQHTSDGPIVVLVGHYCDYVLDRTDDMPNVMIRYKRVPTHFNGSLIESALKDFRARLALLEKAEITPKIEFDWSRLQFILNDRALQSDPAQVKEITAAVEAAWNKDWHGIQIKMHPDASGRMRWTA